jgi:hypothetical protein
MRRSVITLALLVLPLLASNGFAQQRNTRFGVKGLVLLPGEAYVEESDSYFDIDVSFGGGVLVDTRLGEKLLGGLYFDLMKARAYDESGLLLDAGIALKASLGGGSGRLTWRPGIGVGFANLAAVGGIKSTQYLTLRGGLEVVFPGGWLVEAAVYGAPTGGNGDVTVSYGPMTMVRIGRLF